MILKSSRVPRPEQKVAEVRSTSDQLKCLCLNQLKKNTMLMAHLVATSDDTISLQLRETWPVQGLRKLK